MLSLPPGVILIAIIETICPDPPARRRQPPAEVQPIQFGEQFYHWISEPGHLGERTWPESGAQSTRKGPAFFVISGRDRRRWSNSDVARKRGLQSKIADSGIVY